MATRLPHSKSKSHPGRALDQKPRAPKGGTHSFVVRIERRACQLLDTQDNLAGSCKAIIDQIRYAGFIPDDAPDSPVSFEITQSKVKTRAAEGTRITLTERTQVKK